MNPPPLAPPAPKPFPWWIYLIAFVLIVLLASLPVISVAVASFIAEANGCSLHEGFVQPCLVGGEDWGQTLYAMGMMGWFMLATIPLGGIGLVVWFLALAFHLFLRSRRFQPSSMIPRP